MKRYAFELSQTDKDTLGVRINPLELLNLNDTKLLDMLDDGFHERVMDPLKYAWLRTATHMKQPIRYGEEQELFSDGGFFIPKSTISMTKVIQELIFQVHTCFSFISEWNENKSRCFVFERRG